MANFSNLLFFLILISACKTTSTSRRSLPGQGGESESRKMVAVQGINSVLSTETLPASVLCPAGGHRVKHGLDANQDGSLDSGEVSGSFDVCNGSLGIQGTMGDKGERGEKGQTGEKGQQGDPGKAGATGDAGTSGLVLTHSEPPGKNCEAGGIRIETGSDRDRDGALSVDEIKSGSLSFICNGRQAAPLLNPIVQSDTIDAANPCEATNTNQLLLLPKLDVWYVCMFFQWRQVGNKKRSWAESSPDVTVFEAIEVQDGHVMVLFQVKTQDPGRSSSLFGNRLVSNGSYLGEFDSFGQMISYYRLEGDIRPESASLRKDADNGVLLFMPLTRDLLIKRPFLKTPAGLESSLETTIRPSTLPNSSSTAVIFFGQPSREYSQPRACRWVTGSSGFALTALAADSKGLFLAGTSDGDLTSVDATGARQTVKAAGPGNFTSLIRLKRSCEVEWSQSFARAVNAFNYNPTIQDLLVHDGSLFATGRVSGNLSFTPQIPLQITDSGGGSQLFLAQFTPDTGILRNFVLYGDSQGRGHQLFFTPRILPSSKSDIIWQSTALYQICSEANAETRVEESRALVRKSALTNLFPCRAAANGTLLAQGRQTIMRLSAYGENLLPQWLSFFDLPDPSNVTIEGSIYSADRSVIQVAQVSANTAVNFSQDSSFESGDTAALLLIKYGSTGKLEKHMILARATFLTLGSSSPISPDGSLVIKGTYSDTLTLAGLPPLQSRTMKQTFVARLHAVVPL